nr:F-box domain, leucine-rich repeat domain, L domain-like protein [Tanacetum cinerariifolium]
PVPFDERHSGLQCTGKLGRGGLVLAGKSGMGYYLGWLVFKGLARLAPQAAHGIPRLDRDQCGHPSALVKAYNTNKAAFKAHHWVIDPTTGTYNVEKIRRERPENITASELEAMGTYTDDEINRLARGGKQRGHIAGVGRVLPARATASPSTPAHDSTLNSLHKKVDFMMSIFKSDSKYSDMFSQFESGGASGSGGCRDEEEGADHQDDADEDGDGDT